MIGNGRIGKTARGTILLTGLLVLAGCMPEPILPGYGYRMQQPAPPPLQPYVEPLVMPAPVAVAPRRSIKRRYVKRRYYRRQVRCPCLPAR